MVKLILSVLGLGVVAGSSWAAIPAPRIAPAVERTMREYVEHGVVEAVFVSVANADASTMLELSRPGDALDRNSPVWIGSLTTVFTEAVLADLVRDGRLSLADPVVRYLPEAEDLPVFNGRPVSVGDLATQSSGLPGRIPLRSILEDTPWYTPAAWRLCYRRLIRRPYQEPSGICTMADLFRWLVDHPQIDRPGSVIAPSEVGMGLLGEIVGRVDGRGFEAAIRARIAEPLGLQRTAVRPGPGEPWPWRQVDMGLLAGAAGLHSSLVDLTVVARSCLGRGRSSADGGFAATLRAVGRSADGRPMSLGWRIIPGTRRFDCLGGHHAFLGVDPVRRIAVVILLPSDLPYLADLGESFLAAAAGDSVRVSRPHIARFLPAYLLARYAGSYRGEHGTSIQLAPAGHALQAKFLRGTSLADQVLLWPEGATSFFSREQRCTLEFALDGRQRPRSILVRTDDGGRVYRRIG